MELINTCKISLSSASPKHLKRPGATCAKKPSASPAARPSTMLFRRSIAELVIQDSVGLAVINALVKGGTACLATVSLTPLTGEDVKRPMMSVRMEMKIGSWLKCVKNERKNTNSCLPLIFLFHTCSTARTRALANSVSNHEALSILRTDDIASRTRSKVSSDVESRNGPRSLAILTAKGTSAAFVPCSQKLHTPLATELLSLNWYLLLHSFYGRYFEHVAAFWRFNGLYGGFQVLACQLCLK